MTTMRTPPRPEDSTRSAPVTGHGGERRPRFFGLSMTQLIATAFAAITATVLGSFLGVTGTVAGAALASVVTAIGNAVYGTSIRRTRDTVKAVVPTVVPLPAAHRRQGRPEPEPAPPAPEDVPAVMPALQADDGPPALPGGRRPRPGPGLRPGPGVRPRSGVRPAPAPPEHRSIPWKAIAIGSISVFVSVIAALTIVEVIAGRPLSALLGGDSDSGLSLNPGGGSHHSTPAPTPSVITVTPSITVITPTLTQTAPTQTTTVTPSVTTTVSPSPSRSESGSASVSPAASGAPVQLP